MRPARLTQSLQVLLFCALIAVANQASAAITDYWMGGSGTWDTTSIDWSHISGGSPTYAYLPGAATFNSGSGTVTLGANITTPSIFLGGQGYSLVTNGHTLTSSGSLTLHAASTFDFTSPSDSLSFGAITTSWSAGSITINGFVTGSNELRFGTSSSALGPLNLAVITFSGYSNNGAAQIDAHGYVTPTGTSVVPEPASYAALLGAAVVGLVGAREWKRRHRLSRNTLA